MHQATVVMNTWNEREEWLCQAIDSYLGQENVELQLIVSAVAGDPSIETLKKYPEVELCINETADIYSQLNKACERVSTPWYAYAASDDVALPTKIHDEITMCLRQRKKVCASAFYKTDEDLTMRSIVWGPEAYSLARHLRGNFVSDCSLVHKDILDKYGPFDEAMDNLAHWDFWLRVGAHEPDVFAFSKKPAWLYRQHDDARHTRRVGNRPKIQRRELARKKLMKKHAVLLARYNLEHLSAMTLYT